MDLTWWPVAAAGVGAIVLVIAAAVLVPVRGGRERRLLLANTSRLTRLPEYRAVVRRQRRAAAVALALLILMCAATSLISARPGATATDADAARDDVMLCVGAPVDDEATAEFLGHFARQAATAYGTERIGLTSLNRRLMPLTRDYQFAAGRLADYSRNAPTVPAFTAGVEYADYSPTVADALALCLTGFPGFEAPSDTRRSLIYLGPGSLRDPGDDRPSIYTDAAVTEMAQRAGVRISAIATAGRETDTLRAATAATGGRFFRVEATGMDGQLDEIAATAPAGAGDRSDGRQDEPTATLIAALALAALLSVSLLAVRR